MSAVNISQQTLSFMYSLILGATLSVCYDMIRILHKKAVRSIVAIQVIDVLFLVVTAFITFSFLMIFSNGQIRLYLLLGELMGFVLWSVTLSCFLQKIILLLLGVVNKTYVFILKPFRFFYKQIKKLIFRLKNTGLFAKKP